MQGYVHPLTQNVELFNLSLNIGLSLYIDPTLTTFVFHYV